jgi:type VI secretion system ImpA family protein
MSPAELLEPIPGARPAGEDLDGSAELANLEHLRRPIAQRGVSIRGAAPEKPDWPAIEAAAASLLKEKSKDLRTALWWTEARLAQDGFSGLSEGLELLQGLIERYWDGGLRPDDDAEERTAMLEWLNRRLANALMGVVLIRNEQHVVSYGEAFDLERQGRSLFELIRDEGPVRYPAQVQQARSAANQLRALQEALDQRKVELRFSESLQLLDRMAALAARCAQPWAPVEHDEPEESEPGIEAVVIPPPAKPSDPAADWMEYVGWLRGGRESEAAAKFSAMAEKEPCPRDLFLRQLELAGACLAQNRRGVARGILIGLKNQVERLDLERWESPLLLGRMWSLLHQVCSEPGDHALRQEAYNGLCRLVPWQILDLEP